MKRLGLMCLLVAACGDVGVSTRRSGLDATLVAAYGFDEGSGSVLHDATVNHLDGTLAGQTWTASGRHGGALTFNANYVTVPDSSALDLTAGVTIEAWVYPTVTLGSWATVALKETPGNMVYALYAVGASRPAGWIADGGTFGHEAGTKPAKNVWTHVAMTYDAAAAEIKIYTGGVLRGQGDFGTNRTIDTSGGVLRIGGNAVWPGEWFRGRIDELRIYSRPLSAAEIAADMTTPIGGGAGGAGGGGRDGQGGGGAGGGGSAGTGQGGGGAAGAGQDAGTDAGGAGGGSLLVEYPIDEAASGQAPTALQDLQPAPLALGITYVGSTPQFSVDGVMRALRFPVGNVRFAGAFSPQLDVGNKVFDALNGSRRATIEIVADIEWQANPNPDPYQIFGVTQEDGENDDFMLWKMSDCLMFSYTGSGGYPADYHLTAIPIAAVTPGVHIIHAVLDTPAAAQADRMRIYLDGTRAAAAPFPPGLGQQPVPLNATMGIPRPGQSWGYTGPNHYQNISLGGFVNYFGGTGGFRGKIFYAAIHRDALTDAEIAAAPARVLNRP
jgi:concanavalin A-like lectin/glucanase superfamily protein